MKYLYIYSTFTLLLTNSLGAVTPAVTIQLTPASATLRVGQTRDFNVSVNNATDKTVAWFVNNIEGGNTTLGTIDKDGIYKPPASVPAANVVTVKVVSNADKTKASTAAVTLENALPTLTKLTPSQINQGLAYSIDVEGANFIPTSKVLWNDAPVTALFVSSTKLTIKGLVTTIPTGGNATLAVSNPDPGGAKSSTRTLTILPPIVVTVSPDNRSQRIGSNLDFNAALTNTTVKTVDWFVNTIKGGNTTVGKIDANGLYTPPSALPADPKVVIMAQSTLDPKASDTTNLSLLNPTPVVTTVTPNPVKIGPIALTIDGTGFAKGATAEFGGQNLVVTWQSPTRLTATGTVAAQTAGLARLLVHNPDPGASAAKAFYVPVKANKELLTYSDAARFLEKATWGPTPVSIAHLQEIGIDAWLAEQLATPPSTFPDPASMNDGLSGLQTAFVKNALTGNDQLRQRVAFALGQIFVVSGNKTDRYHQMVGFERMLYNDAFGNYRQLMHDATLSPTMGVFLDMVNNDKADPKKNIVPNENYARELLQLFTIGLFELNIDGTRKLDFQNQPISTYSEATVKEFAKVYTGWTYPPVPGFQSKWKNDAYFFGEMVPFEEHHETSTKTLLGGQILPPSQTAAQDMNAALDNIFKHANLAPFVATRLIQHLVMGNPSAAYVGRVAAAFNGPVRGDLKAVVKAILTDAEANAQNPANGHLREPLLFSTTLLRNLNVNVTGEPTGVARETEAMGQKLLFPASVFNFYSPFYRITGTAVIAPEYQNLNASTALARANFVYHALNNRVGGAALNLTTFEELAAYPDQLLDAISNTFLRGQMPAAMKTSILAAINGVTDNRTRARNALYLAGVSSQYQVER